MNKETSVEDALKRGQKMLTYPVMLIMLVILGLAFYLGLQKYLPGWIFPVGILLSFILAWLYWSVMITKWRLWAFDSVHNVHELKKQAVRKTNMG